MHARQLLYWKSTAASFLISLLTSISPATAQTSEVVPPELRSTLAPGTTAWITHAGGGEEKLRVVDVSEEGVTVSSAAGPRHLRASEVTRVRVRQSDSVLDGALIGAGVAVGSTLLFCTAMEPWENCRDDYGPLFRIGALGAAIGAGADGLIRGRRTVFERAGSSGRLHAWPVLGRRAAGLQVSLVF